MKVLFLQSTHWANDDRVWYHQAATLQENGIEIAVCGKDKFADFQIDNNDANVIIADTPQALWKARKSKAKLVYDITEWYPSKKNLRGLCRLHKWAKTMVLCLANLGQAGEAMLSFLVSIIKAIHFAGYFRTHPLLTYHTIPTYNTSHRHHLATFHNAAGYSTPVR